MDVAAGAGAAGLTPAELAAEVAMLGKENPPAPAQARSNNSAWSFEHQLTPLSMRMRTKSRYDEERNGYLLQDELRLSLTAPL